MGKRLALLAIRLLVSVNLLYAAIFLKFAVPGSVTRTNVQEIVGEQLEAGPQDPDNGALSAGSHCRFFVQIVVDGIS